jgi:hypothetical protein
MVGMGSTSTPDAALPLTLALPFAGTWLVQNSPARRVPSHGTDLFGTRYAIDFVAVDDEGRSAFHDSWRTWFASEDPENFVGFGRPILAPISGVVSATYDGQPDHAARRSPLTLAGYALGQASRVRRGASAIAGNHVVIRVPDADVYVALVHLRRGSVVVTPGTVVAEGDEIGRCGNSGNSTEPHVHVQAMDRMDLERARGIPIVFRHYRERAARTAGARDIATGIPGERSVVEPLRIPR